jgi:HTH-type transcriptional regulator/antitoxin HigA
MATTVAPIAPLDEHGKTLVTDLVVRTRRDNQRALRRVKELMLRRDRTPEEDALLDVLANAIEAYETQRYDRPSVTPAELILFLLEQNNQSPRDLHKILGGRSHTSEILANKRKVGLKPAIRLGKHFGIKPTVFVTW